MDGLIQAGGRKGLYTWRTVVVRGHLVGALWGNHGLGALAIMAG
jgi:hypothetical protein